MATQARKEVAKQFNNVNKYKVVFRINGKQYVLIFFLEEQTVFKDIITLLSTCKYVQLFVNESNLFIRGGCLFTIFIVISLIKKKHISLKLSTIDDSEHFAALPMSQVY